jgi:hypothetical protein
VDVAARRKVVARAIDDDGANLAVVHQVAEQVAQLGVRIERQRVLALGNIERHVADVLCHPPQKMLGLVARQFDLSE